MSRATDAPNIPNVQDCIRTRHAHAMSSACSAAALGHLACLQAICSADAKAFRSFNAKTPLHMAARYGHVDCAQLLLNLGADVDGSSSGDDTPLNAAAGFGHVACVALLLDGGARYVAHALRTALVLDQASCARLLLQRGADPNGVFHEGLLRRPLYYAVLRDSLLRLLVVEFGADVNAICDGDTQRTPLHEAARQAPYGNVRLLMKNGARVDALDVRGWTPLHHAAMEGSSDRVEILLRWGSNPHARTHGGSTAFMEASKGGDDDAADAVYFGLSDDLEVRRTLRMLHYVGGDDL